MNILVIEDLENNRDALAGLLRGLGHQVTTIEGNSGGLQELRSHRFDVALWRLPVGDGMNFNALDAVEQVHPGLPVVSFALPEKDEDMGEFVTRLVTLAESCISGASGTGTDAGDGPRQVVQNIRPGTRVSIEALEKEHIRRIVGGTKSLAEAASILGIDAATLYRKRKRYAIPA